MKISKQRRIQQLENTLDCLIYEKRLYRANGITDHAQTVTRIIKLASEYKRLTGNNYRNKEALMTWRGE